LRLVALRAGDGHPHPEVGGPHHQAGGDVVAVAHEDEVQPFQAVEFLQDRQQVGHGLAGMVVIGQAVDDRHGTPACQLQNVLVREGARHDAVHIAAQHARDVCDALALAQPDLLRAEVQRVAAEMLHRHLEADARAQ